MISFKETANWLANVPVLDSVSELDDSSVTAMMSLLGNKGFAVLIGLLQGEQQGLYATLLNLNLGDQVQAHTASVIQGRIKGIEATRQTLLEVAQYFQTPTEGADK